MIMHKTLTHVLSQENGFIHTHCRLSKYHSKKSESTRRTIFNRGSTLQLIVQISSGNVNSSVRARAKTHGRTTVSIELPRGRHRLRRLHLLGPDARIFWAQMPASTLHKSAQQKGPERLHLHVQEHNLRHACLRRCPRRREFKKMPASPHQTRVERYARRPPCARRKDAR